ncbi:hypothetical protein LTR78_009985 [Recurvomyces mirabilis]|uniref:Amino acid transporter transmembrane domain-containing protein n=1 Tax=Recurvomyces mirabilis TaxID=574656 RepID=A0AAE0TMY8_9PEZI|nr:hypothetical protein LTR78_009985 [Recurvomyces mirabilis]KAK5160326.1 hypothetical protein LTS14_001338 [Recurvomyces mirabilis]
MAYQNRPRPAVGYEAPVSNNGLTYDPPTPPYDYKYDDKKDGSDGELALGQETTIAVGSGEDKFKRLSWPALTICLIVEAIALGSLSIPSAFATLGMVVGVILCLALGLIAIYTSYVVGQVSLRHPEVGHYAYAVRLIWGRFGYELTSTMFVLFLVLLVGSHTLTGTIAWVNIVGNLDICALVWSAISAILLFLLALPPTFHDVSFLGYIDFVSIIAAILITIVATGLKAHSLPAGGLSAVDWSVWPPPGTTFYAAFLSTTNIIFAYSFAVCQFSFMRELHTPKDYVKSIWALGLIEIFIYTLVGAIVYAFVGSAVQSPALLSAGTLISRVAFGVALPVIFISGAINSTVVARFIMDRAFANNARVRYVHSTKGWIIWISLIAGITLISWVIAEAIPFFNALLGLISSLFISGFTFYFPAIFWFKLVKQGKWNQGAKNISLSILNGFIFCIGLIVLGCGTYASVESILEEYAKGSVRGSFTCSAQGYL